MRGICPNLLCLRLSGAGVKRSKIKWALFCREFWFKLYQTLYLDMTSIMEPEKKIEKKSKKGQI